ncbi:hypothetical protein Tco_1501796 [Tanacetum coccineum]
MTSPPHHQATYQAPSSPSLATKVALSPLIRSGYQQKDRKPSQNDKTEHGMEKTVQNQGQNRQDLYHLYRVVDDYYEHIPPTGLGLTLLGDLNIIWETAESSDDDFWKDQEEWEIIRWRFHESSGVHTLEIEDGTMIHMLAERRYPLSRELMIRMLEHGMEVEDESETAITLIHLFILWTTEDGDNS